MNDLSIIFSLFYGHGKFYQIVSRTRVMTTEKSFSRVNILKLLIYLVNLSDEVFICPIMDKKGKTINLNYF